MPGWLFEALPSLHKEFIHNHHKRSVARLLRLYGVPTRGCVYQCPQHILGFLLRCVHCLKNVMLNSGIFPKSTGVLRTHDW